ncbi:hypothetical protein AFR_28280 [Actinoplanes friuliensis DSM 7358]|uniref:Uncharacterized protein n=1 Tax=Actinoplanes friuliensis DSM 7358 TaxID=1246995 RepID=U5W4H5_9ACTN|nr:hypothetical protein AFR_28280 [Actinoplanes friuliensis DSM 7358]
MPPPNGGYPAPPPAWNMQPPKKSPYRWVWRFGLPLLILASCFGLAVTFGPGPKDDDDAGNSSARPAAGKGGQPPVTGGGDGASKVKGTVPKGSKASSYAVRKVEDLNRVCDGRFYPKSPKYTGVAPHSIVMGVKNQKESDTRLAETRIELPYQAASEIKEAWNPPDPAKVQLMACVDQVSVGAKVKTCQVDDPKPEKVPMKVSTYQVTLYEVATRRRLAQVRMTGEKEDCGPLFIFVGSDGATYTELETRQLVEGLRRYVEQ